MPCQPHTREKEGGHRRGAALGLAWRPPAAARRCSPARGVAAWRCRAAQHTAASRGGRGAAGAAAAAPPSPLLRRSRPARAHLRHRALAAAAAHADAVDDVALLRLVAQAARLVRPRRPGHPHQRRQLPELPAPHAQQEAQHVGLLAPVQLRAGGGASAPPQSSPPDSGRPGCPAHLADVRVGAHPASGPARLRSRRATTNCILISGRRRETGTLLRHNLPAPRAESVAAAQSAGESGAARAECEVPASVPASTQRSSEARPSQSLPKPAPRLCAPPPPPPPPALT